MQTLAQFKAASTKLMGSDGADRDFGGEVPLESQVGARVWSNVGISALKC